MNVIKLFSLFFVLFSSFSFVYSDFSACSIDFNEPWFEVKDSSNQSVLIVDYDGDTFILGQNTNPSSPQQGSFILNSSSFYFGNESSKFSFSGGNTVLTSSVQSLEIRNPLGSSVAYLENAGTLRTKGNGAYERSQGACLPDGNYCVGNIVESRDYWCDILGNRSGSCTYDLTSSVDCSTKFSDDTDGGVNKDVQGTVTDYITCIGSSPSSSCSFNQYTDYCSSIDTVYEYSNSLSSYVGTPISCGTDKIVCSGLTANWRDYKCVSGAGACSFSDSFFASCNGAPSNQVSSTCLDETTLSTTTTTYSNYCTDGVGCGVSSSSSTVTSSCGSGNVCSGGVCGPAANCGYGLNHGDSGTFYFQSSVLFGQSCLSETRTCNNGALSGSYTSQSCIVDPPNSCYNPSTGLVDIAHSSSKIFYQQPSVLFGQSCLSETRTCNNGALSGSYAYSSCSVGSCVDSSWSPLPSSICLGTPFTQTSNCGTTQSSVGTKTTGACSTCTISSWSPLPSSVCLGTFFTQTSNCGTTQSSVGTKTTGACSTCTPSCPSPSSICSGTIDTSSNGCGGNCNVVGTKTTGACSICTPSWSPLPSTKCSGETFTQNDGCGSSRSETGTKVDGFCACTLVDGSKLNLGSSAKLYAPGPNPPNYKFIASPPSNCNDYGTTKTCLTPGGYINQVSQCYNRQVSGTGSCEEYICGGGSGYTCGGHPSADNSKWCPNVWKFTGEAAGGPSCTNGGAVSAYYETGSASTGKLISFKCLEDIDKIY